LRSGTGRLASDIYQAVGDVGMATAFVNHYLLFEKSEPEKIRFNSS
jgi:hypothetical protein